MILTSVQCLQYFLVQASKAVQMFFVPQQIATSCGGDISLVVGTHLVVPLPLLSVQEQCLLSKCG